MKSFLTILFVQIEGIIVLTPKKNRSKLYKLLIVRDFFGTANISQVPVIIGQSNLVIISISNGTMCLLLSQEIAQGNHPFIVTTNSFYAIEFEIEF